MALAPALTPTGFNVAPSFFHGFSTHPRALAQGLVTLADITASRYFQFAPSNMRDPVLTAHGDRLRAEVFSADNCVYARLDILDSGLDGGDIGYGTTNVDIGSQMRQTLSLVNTADLLHLDVGLDGMTAATLESTATERPVTMPDRWIRGLGNAAQLHKDLVPRFSLTPAQARSFIAQLPSISANGKRGWLVPTPSGVGIAQRKTADAVWIDGLNRLTALKRLVTLQTGMVVFGPADGSAGPAAVAAQLPGANLLLALTDSPSRGYSGEGSLLEALAEPTALDAAALVNAALAFEPIIDVARLTRETAFPDSDVQAALAVLAASGRVGWDCIDGTYFHRELPDDPQRVAKDNPRLVRARSIAQRAGAITPVDGEAAWLVDGGNGVHRVSESGAGQSCTCTWWLRHGTGRGPCAHILALTLATQPQSPRTND